MLFDLQWIICSPHCRFRRALSRCGSYRNPSSVLRFTLLPKSNQISLVKVFVDLIHQSCAGMMSIFWRAFWANQFLPNVSHVISKASLLKKQPHNGKNSLTLNQNQTHKLAETLSDTLDDLSKLESMNFQNYGE